MARALAEPSSEMRMIAAKDFMMDNDHLEVREISRRMDDEGGHNSVHSDDLTR